MKLIMTPKCYPTVLIDWGDTVMKDDPVSSVPMAEWQTVEAVQGIQSVLEYLHSSGRRIVLATSAAISDESQIHGALARVNLDKYFFRIYCFKNTGLTKGEAFYRHVLNDLGIQASEALMVGDSFKKDVLDSNKAGIYAVWFNPKSDKKRTGKLYATVHMMDELLSYFTSFDQ
jgi:putative hydrolase of the HAD superfamily